MIVVFQSPSLVRRRVVLLTFCRHVPTQTPEGALSAVKIVRRLRRAGFETYLYYSVQKDEIICKIR